MELVNNSNKELDLKCLVPDLLFKKAYGQCMYLSYRIWPFGGLGFLTEFCCEYES